MNDEEYNKKRVSINVHQNTLDRIAEYGCFGESYEDVINKIIDIADSQKRQIEGIMGNSKGVYMAASG